MDFAFSDDQQQLRTAVREMLADRLPPERLHAVADSETGGDPALWAELVSLGWVGLSAPDAGGSFLDEAVVVEEAGYALLPGPLLGAVVAGPVLAAGGADPTRRTAVAWAPADVIAEPNGDGWRLTGRVSDVADLGLAEQVVVVAGAGEGAQAFLLDPAEAEVRVRSTTDRTRRLGELTADAVPVRALPTTTPSGDQAVTLMRRRARAALALESVGVAQRALDLAAEHARTREQFGRVIGTYQGVSHRVADVFTRTELARSLAYRAAWSVDTREADPDDVTAAEVDDACAAAKAFAGEAAVFACESAIQVLGGIGMTWEHVVQRFYKRALGNEASAGSPAEMRALLAASLLDT